MVKFRLYSLVLFLVSIISVSAPHATETLIGKEPGEKLFPDVEKVSNDLYTAKIPGKKLRLVMERVDSRTQPLWLQYISVQSGGGGVSLAGNLKNTFDTTGSAHFKNVLMETSYLDNEIWVAYITKAETPEKIPDYMKNYEDQDFTGTKKPFARNIEMFVTVTSNPKALIISNMGISLTIESALWGRTPGTSLDLLSFSAKVMLRRNPDRKFMINAPGLAMENIIIKALPGSVFIGTREMQKIMKERQNLTLQEFSQEKEEKERDELKRDAQEDMEKTNINLEKRLNQRKPDETEKSIREKFAKKIHPLTMLEIGKDGKYVVSEEKVNARLKDNMKEEFDSFKNPYSSPFSQDRETRAVGFLEFMKKYPPIISATYGKVGLENLTIFEPKDLSKIWLSINESDKDYQWVFTEPFSPQGITHFIAVDLVALADSRKVE